MALQKDILEIERKHAAEGPHDTIYLFPEGTFYRAYEWSAWLCCRFVNQFKATKREVKGETGETVVFVGFPITSLGKFVPEDAHVAANDDKSVRLALSSVFQGEDAGTLRSAFEEWKASVPLATPRKSTVRDDLKEAAGATQPHRMSDIMLRIMAFPIEQNTPMECMAFIAEVKQQLANLL